MNVSVPVNLELPNVNSPFLIDVVVVGSKDHKVIRDSSLPVAEEIIRDCTDGSICVWIQGANRQVDKSDPREQCVLAGYKR